MHSPVVYITPRHALNCNDYAATCTIIIGGKSINKLAKAFRELPVPVIGRIADDALWFDLRCLEDQNHFVENLRSLAIV